ncbi:hypothetical protein [Aestuariivivens sediminis]|uniref:hypothetical protein n=1 Tax=Aestuariivivens sediminis TaxID=2913557 RepID=UPI001F561B82|nr:hypothetical protein [Aestuariivivens sediminis]
MDELEVLKKDWNKQDQRFRKLSYGEIYKMILKKSSSIVKWIFIISLLEFVFWFVISFLLKGTSVSRKVEALEMDHILIPLSVVSYIILIYFFYLFYKNYRNISATDNTKSLMENILKTRRTVKYYVIFNLVALVIGTVIGTFYALRHSPEFSEKMAIATSQDDTFKIYAGTVIAIVIALAITILFLLVFYYLIYGLLLKRLNKNYRELKKLEV